MTLRIILAIVLIAHGLGHAMGAMPALGMAKLDGWHDESRLLTPVLGKTLSRVICIFIYVATLIAFVGAGLALLDWLIPHEKWRTLAVTASILSAVAILIYWNGLATLFNRIAALAVDLAVLVAVFSAWPAEADMGF